MKKTTGLLLVLSTLLTGCVAQQPATLDYVGTYTTKQGNPLFQPCRSQEIYSITGDNTILAPLNEAVETLRGQNQPPYIYVGLRAENETSSATTAGQGTHLHVLAASQPHLQVPDFCRTP